MGLRLFPPPPPKKRPARKPSTRRNGNAGPASLETTDRAQSPETANNGRQSALDGRMSSQDTRPDTPPNGRTSPLTVPEPAALASEQPRSHTSFSQAPTLVRGNSTASRTTPPQREEPVMRSIFPRYNPEVPLEYQDYFPTQSSPRNIPQAVISRRPYSPGINNMSPGLASPMSIGSQLSPGHYPRRSVADEVVPEPSSVNELRELWKVTNGWRVSASEGRKFYMKMTSAVEEPVHTLSSSTQPFYTLRLDPTSTSAQVTLSRQDPNKTPGESVLRIATSSSKPTTGIEALNTTLEENSRRMPPNDGLIALLYPRAAANMVLDLAGKSNTAEGQSVIAAAERECGRLIWDEDSKRYYLRHPAVSSPFLIDISSSPAWSRVEYTLEHPQLPHNLIRLVRDGSGGGILEVDTGVAAKIDCFYIVDVAIAAVLLVAIDQEKKNHVERFEAPPLPVSPMAKTDANFQQMEMDLESQESPKYKMEKANEKEKVPGCCGMLWMMIKCMAWCVKMAVKGLAAIIVWVSGCLTRKK